MPNFLTLLCNTGVLVSSPHFSELFLELPSVGTRDSHPAELETTGPFCTGH